MAEPNKDISTLSPDRLLGEFTKPRLPQCIGLATVIVVATVAVFSIGDAVAMFTGSEPTEETAEAQPDTAPTPAPTATTDAPAATTDNANPDATAVAGTNTGDATAAQPAEGDAAQPDGENAYVKSLRETAKPEDIPNQPGLGISIEDTQF